MFTINELVKQLRPMINIASPYYHEKEIMDYCQSWLEQRGISVFRHQYHEAKLTHFSGENLLAVVEGEPGGPTICLNGHLDTVPLCDGWTRDPYSGVIEGDQFYGLGAVDMKGGCLAAMLIFDSLAHAEQPFYGKLILTLVSDEEGPYGLGCNALIEDGLLAGVECSISTEPTAAFAGYCDVPCISLGARGTYIYQVDFHGQAAHASQPELGLNAAEQASRFAIAATASQPQLKGQLGRGSLCLLKISSDGGSCSVPDFARVTIHRHVNELEDEVQVLSEAVDFCREARISCPYEIYLRKTPSTGSRCYAPYLVGKDDPYAAMLIQAVLNVTGKQPICQPFASIGDFNYLGTRLNGAPCLIMGPAGGNAHGADEYVSLLSLQEVTNCLYEFLCRALRKTKDSHR